MPKLLENNIVKLLNYRINQEELSSRIYLAVSLWLNNSGFTGASKVFKSYSDEELVHADKARNYLLDLNYVPETNPLQSVVNDFDSLPQVLQYAYNHELEITKQCKELAGTCNISQDFMTFNLALWYLNEQVEELAKTQYWLDRLDSFGTDKIALRLLDNEMGE